MQNRKRDTDVQTDSWTLWEKARVGCFERTALKQVYYLGWNRSPAQAGCMRQSLGPGALGKPRGSGWRGRWEGGSGWGTHVNPWLFHFNGWQNSLQIKRKEKKRKEKSQVCWYSIYASSPRLLDAALSISFLYSSQKLKASSLTSSPDQVWSTPSSSSW